MERIALVARLNPDAVERARELAAVPPAEEPGITRSTVFISSTEVVWALEGDDPERSVREWLDDPVLSTMLEPWLPLFDGPLHAAREAAHWESGPST